MKIKGPPQTQAGRLMFIMKVMPPQSASYFTIDGKGRVFVILQVKKEP